MSIDVADGGEDAKPAAGIFGEVGIGGLEEDLDAVERADYRFCLSEGMYVSRGYALTGNSSNVSGLPHIRPIPQRDRFAIHS